MMKTHGRDVISFHQFDESRLKNTSPLAIRSGTPASVSEEGTHRPVTTRHDRHPAHVDDVDDTHIVTSRVTP